MAVVNYCYMKSVASRVPFASVNMSISAGCVRRSWGVIVVSGLHALLQGVVCVGWGSLMYAFVAADSAEGDDDDDDKQDSIGLVMFLLTLSLYWTTCTIRNSTRATIAGVVASWWYKPTDKSPTFGSYFRASTTSLGSVAFGSLLSAVIMALRDLARRSRYDSNGNGNLMSCLAECVLQCMGDIIEYFNKYAFTYVGIYGYSYMESGRRTHELFRTSGWTAVINDNLVSNALFMMSVTCAIITSIISYSLPAISPSYFGSPSDSSSDSGVSASTTLALWGFVTSLILTLGVSDVIVSGVCAVYVCVREGAEVLEVNHEEVAEKVREAYWDFHRF